MRKIRYANDSMDNHDLSGSNNYLLDRRMAARFLGIKEHTLAVWGMSNRYHLPYVKVGRLVKYRLSDLREFLERNVHR